MNELTEKKAIAFISSIAQKCKSCLRRSPDNCRDCLSQWATDIMADYNADKQSQRHVQPDYSLSARMMRICNAIEIAKHPLSADQIDLQDLCTPQLKLWTLKHMCERGILGRRRLKDNSERKGNSQYGYFIANKTRLPVL